MMLRHAALALSLALMSSAALAQANAFQLVSKQGRVIGKASYTISKGKDGSSNVKAKFEYRTGFAVIADNPDPDKPTSDGSTVTDTQISTEYKVDANGNYLSGFMQNSANQMITSFTPSKPRDVIVIGQMQGGASSPGKSLAMPKPDFSVAADYDPSAMQVLLTTVLTHPSADHLYLVAVPAVGRGVNQPMYIKVGDPVPATGTLDGKPVTLKMYPLGWTKTKGALYADENGVLMQANVGAINTRYVRNKFVLDEAAK